MSADDISASVVEAGLQGKRGRRVIEKITTVEHLEQRGLENFRTLRRNDEHYKKGIFIAEGNKVVLRLLAGDFIIVSMLMTQEWFDRCRENLEQRREPVQVFITSDSLIKMIVGFNYHQGIIAVAKIPQSHTIETQHELQRENALVVAFDELNNAENVGVIIRNCAACGVDALITSRTSSDPYLRRSVRNSMGSVFMLPVVYTDDLAETMRKLRNEYGFSTVAAHLGRNSTSLHSIDFRQKTCVILGNEHHGISPGVLAECSAAMMIPMERNPIIDSFNVGCASAIILHEAFRQRSAVC